MGLSLILRSYRRPLEEYLSKLACSLAQERVKTLAPLNYETHRRRSQVDREAEGQRQRRREREREREKNRERANLIRWHSIPQRPPDTPHSLNIVPEHRPAFAYCQSPFIVFPSVLHLSNPPLVFPVLLQLCPAAQCSADNSDITSHIHPEADTAD